MRSLPACPSNTSRFACARPASRLLAWVGELARLDDVHLDALRQATDGDTALDLGFLNTHPHTIGPFGPDPTALTTAQVAAAALMG
ncbi:hypothetical protein [Streptomyces sp. NPDC097640]|uniref:hypothetical protein n=1 Tax=Streptomyces sp. NPDC097640 TaxID=3157229 RepID=UPI0033255CB4